ncbi:apoptosis-inducing factor 1, mitochondrial-like [Pectinophora gossypiella]|uniref:apoptosis-inducing factor 1, mitochondrial-like n=1 Tax=Pectinophora gossypiella TaxID=13191 RepID=UPI00214E34D5|nr:apoptosis-inducing factor 1, mitochondrial-like [Pectinophora gossypiella]
MLDCAKQRGPCSGKPVEPPPCPPPPPPPPRSLFWPLLIGAILSFLGLFYKYYLYLEEREKADDSKPVWRPRPRTRRPFHEQDLPPCVQYLIVGTGAAGWAAYSSIMEHDKNAKVFFVTKEDSYPYVRPPLSKHMWWNGEPPDIRHLNYVSDGKRKSMYYAECKHFMDPVKFYRKETGPAVSIGIGWCVLRIDADEHIAWIKTQCGERPMYYERCLLAVGSKPKKSSIFKTAPKFVRERVTTIREIRDLEIAYRKVRDAKHVTIIGGGHLGAELAWHLGKMHKQWFPPAPEDYVPPQFLHVFKDKGILSGILPEYLSEWAAEKIKCENVSIMPKTQVYDAFESPDGRLELTLSNGQSLITDYVLIATGSTPREELAEPSFLELDAINGGFHVNTELQARTHLYVAGDAASVYSQWKNTRLRMEHFSTAVQQGYIAGANMAGYWTPCNMEPHWWFRIDDEIHMEVVGEVGACMPIVGLFRLVDKEPKKYEPKPEELEKPCYKDLPEYKSRYSCGILFYLRDEYVVGIVFWNLKPIEDRMEVATEILRARPTYEDISLLAELLGFPDQECITYIPEENFVDKGPCIDMSRSKWNTYEDYDKVRQLSKVELPEIVPVYPKREI